MLLKLNGIFFLMLVGLVGCDVVQNDDPLLGQWEAANGELFEFQDDGAYIVTHPRHGSMYGTWERLSDGRVKVSIGSRGDIVTPEIADGKMIATRLNGRSRTYTRRDE